MKLQLIESSISRREFLRRSAAGLMTMSPLGKFLSAHGVAPAVVQGVEVGVVKPWAFPFIVNTGTHYGRGGAPYLSDQFNAVESAASIAKRLTNGKLGFGADEDAFFAGELAPKDFAKILNAADKGHKFEINGNFYQAIDEGDSITLEPIGNSEYITVWKNGLPSYLQGHGVLEIDAEEAPVKTWWDSYGMYGDEPIDAAAREVIEQYDLDMSERHDIGEIEDDEEYEEDEEQEPERPPKRPREFYGSMHQLYDSFNRKLEKALSG